MTASDVRTVTVERDIAYPPEKIWRALTQPHLIADWLMQNDFVGEVGQRFGFTAEWGSVECKVLEVEAERSLSYTWDALGLVSVVTWTLTPSARGTHLRMDQTGFRMDQEQAYQGARFGWPKLLDKMERTLSGMDS